MDFTNWTAAELIAFSAECERRIEAMQAERRALHRVFYQAKSIMAIEAASEPMWRLLGWWDERDDPPTPDFMSWPENGWRCVEGQERN